MIEEKRTCQRCWLCSTISSLTKTFVQFALFVVFLYFFGLPAIERYHEMKVMVVTSKRDTEGIEAPAITIAALNPDTLKGWKGNISVVKDLTLSMGIKCGAFEDCLAQNSYALEEVVKQMLRGFTKKTSLLNQMNLSSSDMTYYLYGQAHTLDIKSKMGPDAKID